MTLRGKGMVSKPDEVDTDQEVLEIFGPQEGCQIKIDGMFEMQQLIESLRSACEANYQSYPLYFLCVVGS